MSFVKTPEVLRGIFAGDRIYSVRDGTHLIVPGEMNKPMGAIVAREVYVRGFANVQVAGLVHVFQAGGFVTADDGARIDIHGGQVESLGAQIDATGNAAVIARNASVVMVAHSDDVTVHAYDDTVVIVHGGRPHIKLFDRAKMVRLGARRNAAQSRCALAA